MHSVVMAILLSRYHGCWVWDAVSYRFYYFDFNLHQWPALPVFISILLILIVLPSVVSILVARRHPFISLESSRYLICHSIILILSLLVNGYLYLVFAMRDWGGFPF